MFSFAVVVFCALVSTRLALVEATPAAAILDVDGELVMKVGVKVQRGPDWQYGKQDGGKRSIGIVIEIGSWRTPQRAKDDDPEDKHDRVRVLWKATGTSNVYRYGFEGKYDVVVVDKSTKDVDWGMIKDQLENLNLPSDLPCDARDKEVLLAFHAAAGGRKGRMQERIAIAANGMDAEIRAPVMPGWRQEWGNHSSDPCLDQWAGVKCRQSGRVYAIELPYNNLRGTLSSRIGELSELVSLNLANNKLSGAIPASLFKLQHLEYVSLHVNSFNEAIPAEIVLCRSLKWLSLYGNKLKGTIPRGLLVGDRDRAELPGLTHVYLQQNYLEICSTHGNAKLEEAALEWSRQGKFAQLTPQYVEFGGDGCEPAFTP